MVTIFKLTRFKKREHFFSREDFSYVRDACAKEIDIRGIAYMMILPPNNSYFRLIIALRIHIIENKFMCERSLQIKLIIFIEQII